MTTTTKEGDEDSKFKASLDYIVRTSLQKQMCQWLMPVILATQVAEIRRILV
jgi:hypothetical protein